MVSTFDQDAARSAGRRYAAEQLDDVTAFGGVADFGLDEIEVPAMYARYADAFRDGFQSAMDDAEGGDGDYDPDY
jgi:hypothetical protein